MKPKLAALTLAWVLSQPMAALAADAGAHFDWSQFSVSLAGLDWINQNSGVSILMAPPGGPASQDNAANWVDALSVVKGPASVWADATELEAAIDGITTAVNFAEIYASRYGDFTLAPHTTVEFSLPASVFAGNPLGVDIILSAGIWVSGPLGAGFDSADVFAGNGVSDAGTLSVSLANATDDPITGHFSANINVNAFAALVPEPESYAMMLVGLGLIGWVSRRRPA